MGTREIRGLTLHQPWAFAIAHLDKRVENRTWEPPAWLVGGFLAIHAGKTFDREAALSLMEEFDEGVVPPPRAASYASSAIVAVARVEEVRREPRGLDLWWCGPVGWYLGEVVAIDPVPCRGAQGLWTLPPDVLATVRERWKAARGAKP
jgi:hypothetical protein